ncbi:MAG: hypothetical protein ABSD38_33430, partial [Syntrophorhabdales bacterium]
SAVAYSFFVFEIKVPPLGGSEGTKGGCRILQLPEPTGLSLSTTTTRYQTRVSPFEVRLTTCVPQMLPGARFNHC